jgi:multimeric flavodoxin WrbA
MTILGSPRRQGNTAKVLGWIEEQFQAAGHEVDSAKILDYPPVLNPFWPF